MWDVWPDIESVVLIFFPKPLIKGRVKEWQVSYHVFAGLPEIVIEKQKQYCLHKVEKVWHFH